MKYITFDDVLLMPKFSNVLSRKNCQTNSKFGTNSLANISIDLPVISSNMDTITEEKMANLMSWEGGLGALHRFCSIEENVEMFKRSSSNSFVSFGTGEKEINRALTLAEAGATNFILDVAHGASRIAVETYNNFRENLKNKNVHVMVGNFATAESIRMFLDNVTIKPDSFKVGIGGGSMCTTRIVTGVGVPTLASVIDCVKTGYPIIADGGIRNSGDVAKSLAAGAKAVMIGSMLSGTYETPAEVEYIHDVPHKVYRGSASKESYEVQGKIADHRTPEGESTYVRLKGSASQVMQNIRAGLLSSMSYLNATNLDEFRENATFIDITYNGMLESKAHGKI